MKMKRLYVMFVILLSAMMSVYTSHASDLEETTIAQQEAERKEKAARLGLSDWVDEEGYLVEAFYDGKSDRILTEMGLDGLVRTLTEEEVDAYTARLNAGISLFTVTRYEKVSQINPSTGNYLYTGIFEVDGKLAYCIQRSAATPPKGSPTGTPTAVTNENIRKVLYYGYNGPSAKGYTYVETALAAGEANGDGDNALGRTVLAEIKTYAVPPSEFKVWKVETNGGTTQDLAYYTMEEKGYIRLKKVSGNEEATAGNGQYSLTGALYGIYSDSKCASKVGEFTIKESGFSETLQLSAGTYYIKELSAPPGYELDQKTHSVSVTSSQTKTMTVSDDPKMLVPGILARKQDSETGKFTPQGLGTFRGAQFLVKYFRGVFAEGVNPEEQGEEADRQWVFATDGAGTIRFEETYLVDDTSIQNDALWENSSGKGAIPYGTLTFQEIKAPDGYLLNSEIFVRRIGTEATEFETVIVPETMEDIDLLIKKVDEKGNPLAGAEFTVYSDKECTVPIMDGMTGSDGTLLFTDITIKTYYYIVETKVPEGYEGDTEMYEIYTNDFSEGHLIYLEIVNKKIPQLPNTGGAGIMIYICIGGSLCMAALKKGRKQNEKNKNF